LPRLEGGAHCRSIGFGGALRASGAWVCGVPAG
jgi:hypothetical protein